MARPHLHVTFRDPDLSRIPDVLLQGATMFLELQQRGLLDELAQRLHIERQGGYTGLDAYLMLLLFVAAGPTASLKDLWHDLVRPHNLQLAALAGRRSMPSASSMTRLLQAVDFDILRPTEDWLLTGLCDADALLSQPCVMAQDANGESWHVFDIDPTVVTLRQRALPQGPGLPPPVRRAFGTGAPGYAGRKRGEIQYGQTTVQHAGARLWLHAQLSVGNGDGLGDFTDALDTVIRTTDRLCHPRERCMARMDGAYGNVPWFTACIERSLPFVTRLNRRKMYRNTDILALLRSGVPFVVPDSLSGPTRAAIDLGWHTIQPGKKTRRPDGSPYEPVRVRLVASLFPTEQPPSRGQLIDGMAVELFATTLPAEAWPAEQVVAAYFGRSGQENGFAQEDRELLLSRIASYDLPGQELAVVVGLSLWNLLVVGGFLQHPPPQQAPTAGPAHRRIDERVLAAWPRDPVVTEQLCELDWEALLSRRPGWSFHEGTGALVCPEGRELSLATVRASVEGREQTSLIFIRPAGGCQPCASRPGCLRSARQEAVKHAEVAIPKAVAEALRVRLHQARSAPPGQAPAASGQRQCTFSLFVAARARRLYRSALLDATLRVWVQRPLCPRRPVLLATDAADRQRRRLTRAANVARYALPDEAIVRVEVSGSRVLQERLGQATSSTVSPGATG
jgi:hypothetical protein